MGQTQASGNGNGSLFYGLHEAIPDGGKIVFTLSRPEEGRLTASVVPEFTANGKPKELGLPPFTAAGTVEEFEIEFLGRLMEFAKAQKGFVDNLPAVVAAMEGKTPKESRKKDAPKPGPEKADRTKGKPDKGRAGALATADVASDEFQLALREANQPTLETAMDTCLHVLGLRIVALERVYAHHRANVADFNKSRDERNAAEDAMEEAAKALESLTGKDVFELGLDPAQASMLEGGAAAKEGK
jgi:PRTRC genetic system protein E